MTMTSDNPLAGRSAPVRSFASDNAAGAHPLVVEAVAAANHGHALAYGDDPITARLEQRFCELFDTDVVTRLAFNGTGANVLALGTLLAVNPGATGAVICTDWSHINVDETAAPERVLGAKLIDVPTGTAARADADPAEGAKLTPDQIVAQAHFRGVVHHPQPAVVSITQSTELGTVYSVEEVSAIVETAHDHGMLVHLDGARLANATAALGSDVAALRSFTVDAGVDAVSFGATKVGALGAEAVVFLNPDVATGSEFVRKQVTQLASKMRYLSAQFLALLNDDLWIRLGAGANATARRLHQQVAAIDGIDPGPVPAVNAMFPHLPPEVIPVLQEWSFFWPWDPATNQVRWMTAWDTTDDDVDTFVAGVRAMLEHHR